MFALIEGYLGIPEQRTRCFPTSLPIMLDYNYRNSLKKLGRVFLDLFYIQGRLVGTSSY